MARDLLLPRRKRRERAQLQFFSKALGYLVITLARTFRDEARLGSSTRTHV